MAKDLVQDALVRLLESAHSVTYPVSFLRTTALNLWVDHLRKQRTYRRCSTALEVLYGEEIDSRDAFRILAGQESVESLDRALCSLPDARQEAWWLSRVQGESGQIVAQQMGLTRQGVEKTLSIADGVLRRATESNRVS